MHMIIVAERINASRKTIREALEKKDADFIIKEALTQVEAGATYIDVNGGTFPGREGELLTWLAEVVQQATDRPLALDSPDPAALKAALPKIKGERPLINSINLEKARFNSVLEMVKEYKTKVIALCQTDQAPDGTFESKMTLAAELVDRLLEAGLEVDDIFVDPLIFPVAVNPASAFAAILAFETIHKKYPGIHTICGMTNVSHGFPARKLINRVFIAGAIARGLDGAILDPTDRELMSAVYAAEAVFGRDEYGMTFIEAFQDGKIKV
jgi:5-methyltetrahydrofolate--homocysteine methyltransferase